MNCNWPSLDTSIATKQIIADDDDDDDHDDHDDHDNGHDDGQNID